MAPQRLGCEAGQGSLEFILVISIVVLVGLGAVYRLNTAFGAYAQDYFVNYLACLLETGELPSLGTASIATGECNAQFQAFSLDRGRPLIEDSGGGRGSTGGNSGGSDGSNRFRPGRGGASSVQNGRGGSPNAEFAGNNNGRPSQQSGGGSSSRKAKVKSEAEGFGAQQRLQRREVAERQGIPSSFLVNPRREPSAAVRTVALKKSSIRDLNLRKAVLKKSLDKPKPPKEFTLEAEWGFSTYIRFFMIAGILIALGVLLGGQIMQLRKNWEKSE